mgnify:CR=1 FL=1
MSMSTAHSPGATVIVRLPRAICSLIQPTYRPAPTASRARACEGAARRHTERGHVGAAGDPQTMVLDVLKIATIPNTWGGHVK